MNRTQNLFPVQIENVITAHPQIREAAAISVPDEKFGEVVGIWIVRETVSDINNEYIGPLEVRAWIKDKMNPQVSLFLVYSCASSFPNRDAERA